LKAARAPAAGFWPDSGAAVRSAEPAGLPLDALAAGVAAALGDGVVLLLVERGRVRVLWSSGAER
jgi:hypothetical protein